MNIRSFTNWIKITLTYINVWHGAIIAYYLFVVFVSLTYRTWHDFFFYSSEEHRAHKANEISPVMSCALWDYVCTSFSKAVYLPISHVYGFKTCCERSLQECALIRVPWLRRAWTWGGLLRGVNLTGQKYSREPGVTVTCPPWTAVRAERPLRLQLLMHGLYNFMWHNIMDNNSFFYVAFLLSCSFVAFSVILQPSGPNSLLFTSETASKANHILFLMYL